MASKTTTADLKALCNKFSIRNFLTDLPRMLNDAFTVIYNAITQFYDPDTNSIKATKANIDLITASTITVSNLNFNASTGEIFNYGDVMQELANLKAQVNNITNITKQQIDMLNASIYPTQTLTVGQTAQIQTRITTGEKVYVSYDESIVTVNSSGVLTAVSEGYTLVSVATSVDSEVVYIRVIPVTE